MQYLPVCGETHQTASEKGAKLGEEFNQAKRDFGWATAVLGGLLSAPMVISLVQQGFHVDLNWGFAHFVEFYRGFVHPIVDVIQWPLRVVMGWMQIDRFPLWLKDLHSLSFVGAAIFVRAGNMARRKKPESFFDALSDQLSSIAQTLWIGFTGGGLIGPFLLAPRGEDLGVHTRRQLTMAAAVLAAVVVFYVGNAIVPQIGVPTR